MIYITQLIYIKEGQETIFHRFEDIAIPIISKYNGQLLLRVRPTNESFVEAGMEKPYEIHLVSFREESDFQDYMKDEERKQSLHLKDQSIRLSVLYKGIQL